jgi:hypothetical protein
VEVKVQLNSKEQPSSEPSGGKKHLSKEEQLKLNPALFKPHQTFRILILQLTLAFKINL